MTIEGEEDYQGDNLVAAEAEAQFLQSHVFADYRVELLHGRMKGEEKAQVMERFRSGESQVLVSTTIIEVGVDVPAATVMIVEDADRFGLSQLHQLRGRVGRGGLPSHVFLVSASKKPEALSRLKAMEATDDGFQLADFDLSLRREGDILGNRQSGASALKLVNVTRDRAMIEAAHKDARALLAADPDLSLPSIASWRVRWRCSGAARRKPRRRKMRIIAGDHRGRRLAAPKGMATRPTTDRVRESLMSMVGSARGGFDGAVVLDAFAGSGRWGWRPSPGVPSVACSAKWTATPSRPLPPTLPPFRWKAARGLRGATC